MASCWRQPSAMAASISSIRRRERHETLPRRLQQLPQNPTRPPPKVRTRTSPSQRSSPFLPTGSFSIVLDTRQDWKLEHCPRRRAPTLPLFSGDKNVTSFALASDGALAVGLEDGSLKFSCDGSSELLVVPLDQPRASISYLAFSPDGKTLAGISDGSLRVWQIEDATVREVTVTVDLRLPRDPESGTTLHLKAVLFNTRSAEQFARPVYYKVDSP